jgi:hypothetical protein
MQIKCKNVYFDQNPNIIIDENMLKGFFKQFCLLFPWLHKCVVHILKIVSCFYVIFT